MYKLPTMNNVILVATGSFIVSINVLVNSQTRLNRNANHDLFCFDIPRKWSYSFFKHRRSDYPGHWPQGFVTPSSGEWNSSGYNFNYDPTVGFEPYWPQVRWIYNDTGDTQLCQYYYCNKFYILWGKVCGRSFCTREMREFNNYCDLLQHDCTHPRERWLLLHRGECIPDVKLLNHVGVASRAFSLVHQWVAASHTTRFKR